MGYLSFRKPQPISEDQERKARESGLRVSILCPTRGRPGNVAALLNSLISTADRAPEVIFYIDDDDKSLFPMPGDGWEPEDIHVITGPRITLSACWNECYKKASSDIIMFCGDDIVFRTPGWDTLVINHFANHPDKIIFLHGDDGAWGGRFGTHGFLHRKWIEAVGYVLPPYFSSDFGDTWINDTANALGRRVYLPFVTEHLHPVWGKAEWDQTHRERLKRHESDNVEELYRNMAGFRAQDVEKLKAVMAGAPVG